MDRETAKQYVKEQLEGYLGQQGINTRKPFRCLNPDHGDSNPSMSYDRKRHKAHCFSCGADYDIIDLIKIDYGLSDDKDAFEEAYKMYGVELDQHNTIGAKEAFSEPAATTKEVQKADKSEQKGQDFTPYFLEAHAKISSTDYLQKRGLTAATIEKYRLGYEDSFNKGTGGQVWQCIIIPTTKYTYTVRNIDTEADKKNRIRKVGNNVLFNTGALSSNNPVFIVEGELDALSIIEAGGEALALGSTANYHKLVKLLKERDVKTSLIVLALDNDEDGKKTTDNIIKELGDYKKAAVITQDIYGTYKDANEMLIHDRAGLIEAVSNAQNIINQEKERIAEEYKKNNAANHIKDFLDGIKASANTPFIPTGFASMDKSLDGGLYEGLYIVGAISSLGKTTFIMQIADQVAQGGNDVLIFSLEMARSEIMAKSISRLTILDCLANGADAKIAKTSRGITTGKRYEIYSQEEKDLIRKCTLQYAEYGSRIYITEGIGDIGVEDVKEAVKTHISITGKAPVVIIDYLQILAPYDMKASDKQNTDKAVLELKRLSRDFKMPVIGISSLNRQNYNAPISMEAFKESGAIEYSSDVLIGLQLKGVGDKEFDVNEAKRKNPREVEVVILKNRNGSTGDRIRFEYYAMFNYFKELTAAELAFEDDEELSPPDKGGFRQIMKGKTPFDKE